MVVVGEEDDLDVLVKGFLVGTKYDYRWPRPVIDPICDIGFGSADPACAKAAVPASSAIMEWRRMCRLILF